MKFKKINFEIESLCPLKMDNFVDEEQPKTDEGYRKQARKKVYANKSGELVIPKQCLKASLRLSANELVGIKKGKNMRQTIRAFLNVADDLRLGRKKPDSIVKDMVTRKGTGDKVTRVPTYRPFIEKWKAKGQIEYVPEGSLTNDFIKQALELAGLKYGVLSHRPEFGRFIIKKFVPVR